MSKVVNEEALKALATKQKGYIDDKTGRLLDSARNLVRNSKEIKVGNPNGVTETLIYTIPPGFLTEENPYITIRVNTYIIDETYLEPFTIINISLSDDNTIGLANIVRKDDSTTINLTDVTDREIQLKVYSDTSKYTLKELMIVKGKEIVPYWLPAPEDLVSVEDLSKYATKEELSDVLSNEVEENYTPDEQARPVKLVDRNGGKVMFPVTTIDNVIDNEGNTLESMITNLKQEIAELKANR